MDLIAKQVIAEPSQDFRTKNIWKAKNRDDQKVSLDLQARARAQSIPRAKGVATLETWGQMTAIFEMQQPALIKKLKHRKSSRAESFRRNERK